MDPHRRSDEIADMPRLAEVRHRFLMVRDTRVHLAESGPEFAPTVVLLHGFPQHWYAWRHVIALLAKDRHVVAIDLPGFGWSEPSSHGYSTAERCRTVVDVLEGLGAEEVDLIGHDWGAWLAFRVALEFPARVRCLVAISELHPWPLQRRLLPNLWRMWVTTLFEAPGLSQFVQRKGGVIRWFLRRDAHDPATWNDELVQVYARPTARPPSAHAGQRLHAAFIFHDIARLVLRLDHRRPFTTPTLLLGGNHDQYIPSVLMTVPHSREGTLQLQTIDGGHFLLDENPHGVNAAVQSHLRREQPA